MKKPNNNQQAFLALLKAGLWEKEAYLLPYGEIDFQVIYRLAQEQSVVGIITAGLEHVVDVKTPKEILLTFVGEALQLEQRNTAMNHFIGVLVDKMLDEGINPVLVKGQGIAQCYERPLWRACGDVDFFFNDVDYQKAFSFFKPIATYVKEEETYSKHIPLSIESWEVELHGTLRGGLWSSIDAVIDSAQREVFENKSVRVWKNEGTSVCLPRVDEDILFVFTHILQHFYKEGIGLRQICDWCRLLWTYQDDIDCQLLENRLKEAGILSEWRAFAALVVELFGMPCQAMPFYVPSRKWSRKARRVLAFIIETGNFGHNRDYSYYKKYPFLIYKAISLSRHTHDSLRYLLIFPLDSCKVWVTMIRIGLLTVLKCK